MEDRFLSRGKRTDKEEWVEGAFIEGQMSGCWICIIEPKITKKRSGEITVGDKSKVYEVHHETIGKCTGLRDKNRKLIFEDDFLENMDGLFLITWDKNKAAFLMNFRDYPKEILYMEEMWDDSVIVGNIHDNPELWP